MPLPGSACQCIQDDIQKALDVMNKGANEATKALNKATKLLNTPANIINETVLQAQHDHVASFEADLRNSIRDITTGINKTLNASCFTAPLAEFTALIEPPLLGLSVALSLLDLRLPTININFQISLAVNICGIEDIFTSQLQNMLLAGGFNPNGFFDPSQAFAGMTFPGAEYEAMFKQTITGMTNVADMQGMLDHALNASVGSALDAVQDWQNKATQAFNDISKIASDPSQILSQIQAKIPVPASVAKAAQFAAQMGFAAPGVGGGSFPKIPIDVNFMTKGESGGKANTVLQINQSQTA